MWTKGMSLYCLKRTYMPLFCVSKSFLGTLHRTKNTVTWHCNTGFWSELLVSGCLPFLFFYQLVNKLLVVRTNLQFLTPTWISGCYFSFVGENLALAFTLVTYIQMILSVLPNTDHISILTARFLLLEHCCHDRVNSLLLKPLWCPDYVCLILNNII